MARLAGRERDIAEMNSAGLQLLVADLLLTESRRLDADEFEQAVRSTLPESRLIDSPDSAVMIAHAGHRSEAAAAVHPPILTLVAPVTKDRARKVDASQSWTFPQAEEVISEATDRFVVVEMYGLNHSRHDRVRSFHAALCAAIEQLRPVAIWSPNCERILDPQEVLEDPLASVVNVRLFRVEGEPGVVVMDTLGLQVLGLPDLQCHFRDIDCNEMAGKLFGGAAYLFELGDAIDDGDTIEGFDEDDRWRCQHEMALLGPPRVVIDIDVGAPHAAGRRDR
jgi:hypothetical protein